MEIEVKLPELGDGIKSGDVLEVLIHVGDQIQKEQGILEVETDKATVTLPSSHTGRVKQIHVQAGETVPIGTTVLTLEVDAPAPEATPVTPPATPVPTTTVDHFAPSAAAPTTTSATPTAPSPAPVVETPPSEPSAPVAPPATRSMPSVSAAKASSAVAASVTVGPPPAPRPAVPPATADAAGLVAAGPAVRRFAREVGVDLRRVRGTGEHGRITREDVLDVVRQANQAVRGGLSSPALAKRSEDSTPLATEETTPATATSADTERDAWGPVRHERLTKIRRTIAAKMHESWSTVPRVTNMDDADVTELERIRQASRDDYAARGIKLTTLPFLIKSVAMALRKHPVVNASLDLDAGTIIYKDYVNVGIAVDSDRGLVVPSLRSADQMSIPEIARQLAALAEKVRDNAYTIDDLRGSTFTISNLGAVGGTYSTPIINTPELAILLVGRARKMPVVVDDEIVPRLMMPLSLSYDHRLVDGAAAARFLNDVIGYLKAPSRLLLAP